MIIQSEYKGLGAVLKGMSVADLALKKESVSAGSLPDPKAPRAQAIVGGELARRLGLAVGQDIRIVSPVESTGPMGLVPRSQTFEVVGLFSSGHYQFDQQYLYLTMQDAQDLFFKVS